MKEAIIIGKSVIEHYFTYNKKKQLDDETEFFPTLKTIINGIINTCGQDKEDVQKELELYARTLYCNLWLSYAKEDNDDFNLDYEQENAIKAFNDIYKGL